MAGPGAGTVQAAVAFLTPGDKNYYLELEMQRQCPMVGSPIAMFVNYHNVPSNVCFNC